MISLTLPNIFVEAYRHFPCAIWMCRNWKHVRKAWRMFAYCCDSGDSIQSPSVCGDGCWLPPAEQAPILRERSTSHGARQMSLPLGCLFIKGLITGTECRAIKDTSIRGDEGQSDPIWWRVRRGIGKGFQSEGERGVQGRWDELRWLGALNHPAGLTLCISGNDGSTTYSQTLERTRNGWRRQWIKYSVWDWWSTIRRSRCWGWTRWGTPACVGNGGAPGTTGIGWGATGVEDALGSREAVEIDSSFSTSGAGWYSDIEEANAGAWGFGTFSSPKPWSSFSTALR